MPGAHQVAGENVLQLETVEAARIGAIVRGRSTHQGLEQEQQRHHHEELHQRALARAGLAGHDGGLQAVPARDPAEIVELAEHQQYRRDAGQQHQQAQRAPQEGAGDRRVADQRVIRKVVGVGVVVAGTIGHRGPGRPVHERGELAQLRRVADQVGLEPAVAGRVFEVVSPVRDLLLPGFGFRRRERQRVGGGIVAVGFQIDGGLRVHRGLLAGIEFGHRLAMLLASQRIGRVHADQMQRLGGIVRTEISAVAPDRAVVHQAVLQEHGLPGLDIVAGEQHLALRVDHLGGDRRRLPVAQHGDHDQDRHAEHHHEHDRANPPRRQRGLVIGQRLCGVVHRCSPGRTKDGRRMACPRPAVESTARHIFSSGVEQQRMPVAPPGMPPNTARLAATIQGSGGGRGAARPISA
ncbi:hypothetical protein RLIN73S_04182 [Rhodanobacter lindaniclasticus]